MERVFWSIVHVALTGVMSYNANSLLIHLSMIYKSIKF